MNFNDIPKEVISVLDVFEKNKFEIAIVGGAVRNLIIDHKVKDWDFATNATPEQILKMFDGFYDNAFGTVRVNVGDSFYEITTYRSESGFSDSRRPDKVVWGKSLADDLSRRDFTVNAMAILRKNDQFELIDPFDGKNDLKNKIIRSVGNANDRFIEDGLRVIRAIRFAIQLNFKIEKDTFGALTEQRFILLKIANERIRD